MLMESNAKWWGDFGTRHASHEGLDIAMYTNKQGKMNWLTPDVVIPAMADGMVLNVCPDFLGSSIITELRDDSATGEDSASINHSKLIAVYSHLIPENHIHTGQRLKEKDCIGTIADTSTKKSGIPCHLHISIIEVVKDIPETMLDWNLFGDHNSEKINLINPFNFKL